MCCQEKINTQKVVLTPRFYSLGYVISPRTEVVNGEAMMWIGNIKMELNIAGMHDIALSSAPEVTSPYVTTWVRVGVNQARALYNTVASTMFHLFLLASIEFWTMYSASFS